MNCYWHESDDESVIPLNCPGFRDFMKEIENVKYVFKNRTEKENDWLLLTSSSLYLQHLRSRTDNVITLQSHAVVIDQSVTLSAHHSAADYLCNLHLPSKQWLMKGDCSWSKCRQHNLLWFNWVLHFLVPDIFTSRSPSNCKYQVLLIFTKFDSVKPCNEQGKVSMFYYFYYFRSNSW